MKKILVVGATSAIAEASIRLFAARGDRLYLAGRNGQRLQAIADDIAVRSGQRPGFEVIDAGDLAAHPGLLDRASQALDGLDVLLVAHGTLSDQGACEQSVDLTLREIHTNGLSVVSLLTLAANRFQAQGQGTLAVISSVAGDRGRQSNYVYGSAKALVSSFLSGLGQRLAKHGVAVVNIKPGFVDTPMTAHIAKKGPLWATPDQVARGIVRAVDQGRPVAYLPGFWAFIMLIIRHIPEGIFRRLSL